jgi:AcrR family transcriptional regulator
VRTRRAPADRRAEIAAAARAVAVEQGLDAVTQRSVAARAAVAPALVAHYVASMDALVAETFSAIVADELVEVSALVAAEDDPLRGLGALLATLLDGSRQEVALVWGCAWVLGRRSEPLAAAVRRQMDDWRSLVGGVLAAAQAAGALRCDDLDEAARHVLAVVDGLAAHALVRWGAPAARGPMALRAVEAVLGLAPRALDGPVTGP